MLAGAGIRAGEIKQGIWGECGNVRNRRIEQVNLSLRIPEFPEAEFLPLRNAQTRRPAANRHAAARNRKLRKNATVFRFRLTDSRAQLQSIPIRRISSFEPKALAFSSNDMESACRTPPRGESGCQAKMRGSYAWFAVRRGRLLPVSRGFSGSSNCSFNLPFSRLTLTRPPLTSLPNRISSASGSPISS